MALGDGALAQRRMSDRLMHTERALLFLQGVPGREWYRHVVWVPGTFDGKSYLLNSVFVWRCFICILV